MENVYKCFWGVNVCFKIWANWNIQENKNLVHGTVKQFHEVIFLKTKPCKLSNIHNKNNCGCDFIFCQFWELFLNVESQPPPKKNKTKTTAENSDLANASFPRACSNSCWITSTGLLVHQPLNEHNFIFSDNSEITKISLKSVWQLWLWLVRPVPQDTVILWYSTISTKHPPSMQTHPPLNQL